MLAARPLMVAVVVTVWLEGLRMVMTMPVGVTPLGALGCFARVKVLLVLVTTKLPEPLVPVAGVDALTVPLALAVPMAVPSGVVPAPVVAAVVSVVAAALAVSAVVAVVVPEVPLMVGAQEARASAPIRPNNAILFICPPKDEVSLLEVRPAARARYFFCLQCKTALNKASTKGQEKQNARFTDELSSMPPQDRPGHPSGA